MKVVAQFLLAIVCGLHITRAAADESIDKVDLFTAGEGGYALYRIPGIVRTPGGALLAYCEARKHARADWGQIDILLQRSTDNGRTWSEPRKVVELKGNFERNPAAVAQKLGKPGEITINNPIAIADAKCGAVHLLYCVEYNRLFAMRSDDDGATFSEPLELTSVVEQFRPDYDWQVFATGPGHGICLQNGRLVASVWLSTGKGGHAHRPSIVSTIVSDDGGKTWQRGDIVAGEQRPLKNPNESTLVELSDGRVMINMRSESPERRRAVSISPNGSSQWSPPTFDDALVEPICMASLLRIEAPNGKPRIAFVNPNHAKERRNLSLRISDDDGATWSQPTTIEAGTSAYSDLAVAADGALLCFYERGDAAPYERLTLARLSLPVSQPDRE